MAAAPSPRWIDRHWQARTPLAVVLYPWSVLFRGVISIRRWLYRLGLLRTTRVAVPVVVVGNITAGGTGKTPLVLWLAAFLRDHGWRPGIVSRGYGGSTTSAGAVSPDDDPARCGDEPVLLAQRSGCPVWIGRDRVAAVNGLLRTHRECNVVLSDDGLQHYALGRNFEIAVIDAERGLGNGWLLPAGPLREPPGRLSTVDAIVSHGEATTSRQSNVPMYAMRLAATQLQNLLNPGHRIAPAQLRNQRVHAVAGIGNPQRFFAQLQRLGLDFTAHAFPDHHPYKARDLRFAEADAVVMTEKDAVKCRRFATERFWVLPVDAVIDAGLGQQVLRKLGQRDEQ